MGGCSAPQFDFKRTPRSDAAVGNRNGPDTRFTDFELGFGQAFVLCARRSARIAGFVDVGHAQRNSVTRTVVRQAAAAYYRLVHANERLRLLDAAYELASSVYSIADRRQRAGDIAVLDVNVARASLVRVRAERAGTEAAKVSVLGDLRQLLRLDDEVAVDGSLDIPTSVDLDAALQATAQRPVRALEAGIQEAEAELRLGTSFSKPEFGVGFRYLRVEGDQIVLSATACSLPAATFIGSSWSTQRG